MTIERFIDGPYHVWRRNGWFFIVILFCYFLFSFLLFFVFIFYRASYERSLFRLGMNDVSGVGTSGTGIQRRRRYFTRSIQRQIHWCSRFRPTGPFPRETWMDRSRFFMRVAAGRSIDQYISIYGLSKNRCEYIYIPTCHTNGICHRRNSQGLSLVGR